MSLASAIDDLKGKHCAPPMELCRATFTLDNGETVTPCHLPKGHAESHEGWCLGSRCLWGIDMAVDTEFSDERGR